MSATVLYHIFGIRGYRLVRKKIVDGGMEFHISLPREKVYCTDMSPAYTKAVETYLPDVFHVFDRFHVMKRCCLSRIKCFLFAAATIRFCNQLSQ